MNTRKRRDLTQGSILKNLIFFSIPLLIGNLLQTLYNVVDSFWVGKFVGTDALGAVGVGMPIIFTLVSLVMGITMGTTVLISQFEGAKNRPMILKTISNAYTLLGVSALIVSIIGVIFSKPLLELINTPNTVLIQATDYLQIFFAGLIFMFFYNINSSILRGIGDSITPTVFLLISTVINIILDPLLIIGVGPFPEMGIRGAAVATLISQAISAVFSFIYLLKHSKLISLNLKDYKINMEITSKMLLIGLPTGLQQTIVSVGLLVLTSIINTFGETTLAAFSAASRVDQLAHLPAMSLGLAVSTLTGQNIGAGKIERVKDVYKWGSLLTLFITGVITLFVYLFPTSIIDLFLNHDDPDLVLKNKEVIEIGTEYLMIVGTSYIPFALMFVTNGILRGAGDTIPPLFFSITSLWIIRLPLAYILSSQHLGSLGTNGIWIAVAISYVVTLIINQIYYATGRWKKISIIKHKRAET